MRCVLVSVAMAIKRRQTECGWTLVSVVKLTGVCQVAVVNP